MKYVFIELSWKEYLFWQETDMKKCKRINELLKSISRTPFEGIGNPEPLKHELSGLWSRRIDQEHRLIYLVVENEIRIYKCKSHYD